jgi:hypothetical protein|tara:strand:- start:545 stop:1210 length:666 start_codon:yes stop_codon:yes gene_type:complete
MGGEILPFFMEAVQAWPNELIYRFKYPHDISKGTNRALEVCKELPESVLEQGGGTSSAIKPWDPPHQWIEMHRFWEWLHPLLDDVWKAWGMVPQQRILQKSWVNWHPNGAWTAEHDHSAVHQVVAFYMRKPTGSGDILFRDPLDIAWWSYPRELRKRSLWQSVDVEEGDVLIFPGWLRHKTEPNTTDEDRIVLSANFSVNYFNYQPPPQPLPTRKQTERMI